VFTSDSKVREAVLGVAFIKLCFIRYRISDQQVVWYLTPYKGDRGTYRWLCFKRDTKAMGKRYMLTCADGVVQSCGVDMR
jgi:hypothetical protein